jgi:ribosomal protein S18 acetylase RimI-like enzyme
MSKVFHVRATTGAEHLAACRVLTGGFSENREAAAQWLHSQFESGPFQAMTLYAAISPSGRVAAAMTVHADGAAGATILGYRAEPGPHREDAEDALIPFVCGELLANGVKVVQLIAKPEKAEDYSALLRHGFRQTCTLTEMTASNLTFEAAAIPPELTLSLFRDDDATAFSELLIATYEDTLDCPELNDVRTPGETLASLRGNSRENLPLWYQAEVNGIPAGVLLLNPAEPPRNWELTYLGLTKPYRNRGYGIALVSGAFAKAREGGAVGMTLTTDRRNVHAIRLYERAGFRVAGTYEVYLKMFSGS